MRKLDKHENFPVCDAVRNLFLAHTPNNIYVSRDVARSLELAESECVLIYEGSGAPEYVEFHCVIYLENPYTNKDGMLRSILVKKNNTRVLKKFIENHPSIRNIYVSDIAWYLNNYIFFNKRKLTFNLYTDGSLSDYRPSVSIKSFSRSIARAFVDLSLLAIPYRPYLGRMAGEDRERISKYYVYRKSSDIFSNKDRILSGKVKVFCPNAERGLYIDGCFLESELTDIEYSKYIVEAFAYMRSLGCTNISAKQHPLNRRTILGSICKREDVDLLMPSESADSLIPSLGPSVILSHVSSVLIDYASCHEKLRVISLLDESMIRKLANSNNVRRWIDFAVTKGVLFPKFIRAT